MLLNTHKHSFILQTVQASFMCDMYVRYMHAQTCILLRGLQLARQCATYASIFLISNVPTRMCWQVAFLTMYVLPNALFFKRRNFHSLCSILVLLLVTTYYDQNCDTHVKLHIIIAHNC